MSVERSSGVLLHPSSLPGPYGMGDFGPGSRHFIDWLAAGGQHLWQILPFAPPGCGNSPYMSMSTLAGDPMLVSPQELCAQGLLGESWADESPDPSNEIKSGYRVDFAHAHSKRDEALRLASARLNDDPGQFPTLDLEFSGWRTENAWWSEDFALYRAISDARNSQPWQQWPDELRRRDPAAIEAARHELSSEIRFWLFTQWQFDKQWLAVRAYGAERGVRIIGDMPIYCALDSVDVWQNPELFQLDQDLMPRVVAGVPPDYFSDTGQLWGNPLYEWQAHKDQAYAWWIARMRRAMTHADIVRIDHFRAMAEYWAVAADSETAITGEWMPGPGKDLFDTLAGAIGGLPIIAEDLGTITPDVIALRDAIGLPGMCVLQFAFGDGADNRYAPHNLDTHCVLYTGTHDNDTTVGWFTAIGDDERARVQTYLKSDGEQINWELIHAASASVAAVSVYPMQDILGLGSDSRMNTPGEADGQWSWRFSWDQVQPWHADRLRSMSEVHGRHPPRPVIQASQSMANA